MKKAISILGKSVLILLNSFNRNQIVFKMIYIAIIRTLISKDHYRRIELLKKTYPYCFKFLEILDIKNPCHR